jgi:hypothetical protein
MTRTGKGKPLIGNFPAGLKQVGSSFYQKLGQCTMPGPHGLCKWKVDKKEGIRYLDPILLSFNV